MFDLLTKFAQAADAAHGIYSPGQPEKEINVSINDINKKIIRQLKKFNDLMFPINKKEENMLDYLSEQKKVNTGSKYDKYFNEAQEIKNILIIYFE